jgi:gluconolactonase
MVNLHRWLKRTSPHLLVVGSLVVTGLSGCRTAHYSAVEVEPAPATYPTPLMVPEAVSEPVSENVTQAVPYSEPFAASPGNFERAETELNGDLFLKPPAPALAESGSSSGTGVVSGLPFPENDEQDDSPVENLTEVKPEVVTKETKANVADVDPLAESNLFPEDNFKAADDSAVVSENVVTEGSVEVLQDAASGATADSTIARPVTDPFADSFESIVASPEVPVPNPGKVTVSFNEPEAELTPVEPIRKVDLDPEKATEVEVKEEPATGTSSLFTPSKDEQPLTEIKSDGLSEQDFQADELPVTSPKFDVFLPDLNDDASAALPVIAPAVVAEEPELSSLPNLPQLDAKNSIEPKQTTANDLLQPDQLASIAKPDRKLPTTDSVESNSFTRPLFPTTPLKPSTIPQDAVSVVAEIWSPGDSVVFDNSGNAFVSHGKHISKVSPDGSVEPWATMSSPRGHVILSDGSHLVADAGQRAIVKLNEAGEQVRKIATRSDGNFLRAPSDLVADSTGGVYFTDPGYARISNPIGRVHYVAADGSVTVVAQRLAFPEGIALSADGSKLLVVESQNRQVIEFEIRSPGQVGPKQVFAELPASTDDAQGFASGLLVDPQNGRVFIAHGDRQQVEMLSPEGKLLRSIEIGATVNSIAFKDGDFSRVFATGGARSGQQDAGQLFEIKIAE